MSGYTLWCQIYCHGLQNDIYPTRNNDVCTSGQSESRHEAAVHVLQLFEFAYCSLIKSSCRNRNPVIALFSLPKYRQYVIRGPPFLNFDQFQNSKKGDSRRWQRKKNIIFH